MMYHIDLEEWRPIPSEPLLEASSLGRVRSVPYETAMPRGGIKINRVMPTYGITVQMSPNYQRKQLTFRRKMYRLHQLVAEAFHGPRPAGMIVSHKDENPLNNKPCNLKYATRKENHNMPRLKAYQREVCVAKMSGNKVT